MQLAVDLLAHGPQLFEERQVLLEIEIGEEEELRNAKRTLGRDGGSRIFVGSFGMIGDRRHYVEGMTTGDDDAEQQGGKTPKLSKPVCLAVRHLRFSCKWPAVALVPPNLGLGRRGDFLPPIFPTDLTVQPPLEVDAQKTELVGTRELGIMAEAGIQPGEVLDAPRSSQPAIDANADEVDEPGRVARQQDIAGFQVAVRKLPSMELANEPSDLVDPVP